MERDEAFEALRGGRVAELIGMLADSRDFTKVVDGFSLLGLACAEERWALVRPLLALGANPNGAPGEALPPLHWAIERNNEKIAITLLDKGAMLTEPLLAQAKEPMRSVLRSRLN